MVTGSDTTGKLGQTVAAVGVIASLLFVALEIRENTKAVRGETLQGVSQQSMDLILAGLDNPEIRDAFLSDTRGDSLSEAQEEVLAWFFHGKLRADENRLRQVELGILTETTFGQLSSNGAYRLPYFKKWWARNGWLFADDLQKLVEREFLPLELTPPSQVR